MGQPVVVGEVVMTPEVRLKLRAGRRGARDLVDLRLFCQGERLGAGDKATKSGFAIPKDRVPARIELLRISMRT